MNEGVPSVENVIIIGGGPAGLSAAIYNARANLNPLIIAGSPAGGQLILTSEVENYPGFESILGPDLIQKMRNQAQKFGTRIIDENVVKVDFSKRPFEVYLPRLSHDRNFSGTKLLPAESAGRQTTGSSKFGHFDNILYSKSIIIATGAKVLWLGLESERRLRGKGVSACATCDGFFFKNKVVGVVGGGDTALEEALTLTKFAGKVYIFHRRGEFRASKIMQDRVLHHPKIEVIWNAQVEEVLGKDKVEGVKLKASNLKLDGLFIAIGYKPDTDIFKDQIELDEKGYIITSERAGATSVKGVFAAGDCVDHVYRQVGTAVGMGIAAALDTEKYLETNS